MRVKIAILAEDASDSEGKLNILGIFSAIWAEDKPVVYPEMQLVVQFELDSHETGEEDMRIELIDADGRYISAVSGSMDVPRMPQGEPTVVSYIIGLNNVLFPKFGRYEFRVHVDGEITAIPVRVIQATQPRR